MFDYQRHAHDQRGRQRHRGFHDALERQFALAQQRALMEQVVAGIGRQAQFREGDQRRAALHGLAGQFQRLVGVVGRVRHAALGHTHGHARKAVGIQVEERMSHVWPSDSGRQHASAAIGVIPVILRCALRTRRAPVAHVTWLAMAAPPHVFR
ncbi:hypothetical protein D3C87_1397080 [compost metagenome]